MSSNKRLEISVRNLTADCVEVNFGRLDILMKWRRLEKMEISNIYTVHVLKDELRVVWAAEAHLYLPADDTAVIIDQKHCKAALTGLLMDFYTHEDEDEFHLNIETKADVSALSLLPGVAKVQIFNRSILQGSEAWRDRIELLLDSNLAIIGGASIYNGSF